MTFDPFKHSNKLTAVYNKIASTPNTKILPDRVYALAALTIDEFSYDPKSGEVAPRTGESLESFLDYLHTARPEYRLAWERDVTSSADTPEARLAAMKHQWKSLDHNSRLAAGTLDFEIKKRNRRDR